MRGEIYMLSSVAACKVSQYLWQGNYFRYVDLSADAVKLEVAIWRRHFLTKILNYISILLIKHPPK